jgi:hypothetical protein
MPRREDAMHWRSAALETGFAAAARLPMSLPNPVDLELARDCKIAGFFLLRIHEQNPARDNVPRSSESLSHREWFERRRGIPASA